LPRVNKGPLFIFFNNKIRVAGTPVNIDLSVAIILKRKTINGDIIE